MLSCIEHRASLAFVLLRHPQDGQTLVNQRAALRPRCATHLILGEVTFRVRVASCLLKTPFRLDGVLAGRESVQTLLQIHWHARQTHGNTQHQQEKHMTMKRRETNEHGGEPTEDTLTACHTENTHAFPLDDNNSFLQIIFIYEILLFIYYFFKQCYQTAPFL
jgi:hypothetical protein